jgi:hypothetical protein
MVVGFMLAAMDDQTFLSRLEACTLPAQHFNHASHLGVPGKYHASVTTALVRLLHAPASRRPTCGRCHAGHPRAARGRN